MRTGRVVAVGTKSVVLADVANPAGGLTDAEYALVRGRLRHHGVPAVTGAFGEMGDVDENGRVVIFYTRAVNELTPPGSGSYVGGYFHPRDLFPTRDRDGLSACETSNFAEMFYMLVPDPTSAVGGSVFSRDLVLQTSLGTIGARVPAPDQRVAPAVRHRHHQLERGDVAQRGHEPRRRRSWCSTGRRGFQPRQNLRGQRGPGEPAVDERLRHLHGAEHPPLRVVPGGPGGGVAVRLRDADANDLATRGAGWAFLRYAADRRGGNERQLWRDADRRQHHGLREPAARAGHGPAAVGARLDGFGVHGRRGAGESTRGSRSPAGASAPSLASSRCARGA